MAAFTHPNPLGSRYNDARYGVFYCARQGETAIAEMRHHSTRFMQATQEPPTRLQMRPDSVEARGQAIDLRPFAQREPRFLSSGDIRNCLQAAPLEYQWHGHVNEAVYEVNRVF